MVAEGINRASLQMCRCPSLMELMVNTSRADGSLLAIHCRGGGSLQLRKKAGKPYSIRRATYRKQCETVCLKEIMSGESCCLDFIGQHSIDMNAGKGNERTQVNGQSCTLKLYAQKHSLQHLGKEPGRIALPVLRYGFRCPASQQTTAAASALGSHVDDVVSKFDDIKVVLDDQDGVATVDKFSKTPMRIRMSSK